MISAFTFQQLTKAINHYIALDPESPKLLAPLASHTMAIVISGLDFTFHVYFHEKGLTLTSANDDIAHTTIKGSPTTFFQLMKNPQQLPLNNDLEISGDIELGQQVRHFFQRLSVDWEELLSHYVGDHIAYGFSKNLKKLTQWLKEGKQSFLYNTDEYIHHEIQLTPSVVEIENFHDAITQLRNDVERLAMRLQQYERTQQ